MKRKWLYIFFTVLICFFVFKNEVNASGKFTCRDYVGNLDGIEKKLVFTIMEDQGLVTILPQWKKEDGTLESGTIYDSKNPKIASAADVRMYIINLWNQTDRVCPEKIYFQKTGENSYLFSFSAQSGVENISFDRQGDGETTYVPVVAKTCKYTNCKTVDNTNTDDSEIVFRVNIADKIGNRFKYEATNNGKEISYDIKSLEKAVGNLSDFASNTAVCPMYVVYSSKKLYFETNNNFGISYSNSDVYCVNETIPEDEDEKNYTGSKDYGEVNMGDESLDCDSIRDTDTYKILKEIFKWIQIAAPIMLVIFGVLDFGKAVISGDADAMKKSQATFVKRVIIVAAIILLPIIMDLLIWLLEGIIDGNLGTCDL